MRLKSRPPKRKLMNSLRGLRTVVDKILPGIESSLTTWKKNLDDKLNDTTTKVESTLNSQNQKFEKTFNDSLVDIEKLKKTLDGDFKTIKETADTETKTLTAQMKSSVEAGINDFTNAFEQTKIKIKAEINSLLEAAHELDNAYTEQQTELPKLKTFLQLIDLVDDPSRVTDIRFLATIQLTLRKTKQWINLNPSKLGYYPSAADLANTIDRLDELLSKVNFEPPTVT